MPLHSAKNKMKSFFRNTSSFLRSDPSHSPAGFQKAPTTTSLFPAVDPTVDGEDCDHDCASCTVHYPKKFSIDEEDELYGYVKGWNTHLIVATGKSDWVRDVADETGSVMEAVGKYGQTLKNGKCMLSASNMPTPEGHVHGGKDGLEEKTRVLLLPAWKIIDDVGPQDVKGLMEEVIEKEATNTSPILQASGNEPGVKDSTLLGQANGRPNGQTRESSPESEPDILSLKISQDTPATNGIHPSLPVQFSIRSCPHRAIILMCSQKTRDARCGQSAPLLRKEFERILRPMGLYRDLHDERPGGVGVYFISHVGGHKYSANVIVYRREGRKVEGRDEEVDGAPLSSQAVQGIWLARVRPEDCEGIIKYTVLQGKVVKPERQLRGGFDREKGLISW